MGEWQEPGPLLCSSSEGSSSSSPFLAATTVAATSSGGGLVGGRVGDGSSRLVRPRGSSSFSSFSSSSSSSSSLLPFLQPPLTPYDSFSRKVQPLQAGLRSSLSATLTDKSEEETRHSAPGERHELAWPEV